jgi:selenocysteine-specific elongation factor
MPTWQMRLLRRAALTMAGPSSIFSVSGFGTVVTGSVKSGVLSAGCEAYVLPPQKKVRVRRMERFGAEVSEVAAGDRASLNLVGLSKEEFVRGMLVSDRPLTSSTLLDVRLRLFDGVRPLELWSQAMYIMSTFEAQARIHLLEHDRLNQGDTGLAQLHLARPCVAQTQDAFVLRSSSNDMTLGGGEIVDPHPLHHRKRRSGLVDELKIYDVSRDLVLCRSVALQDTVKGKNYLAWDGRNSAGGRVANGVYYYQITSSNGPASAVKALAVIR